MANKIDFGANSHVENPSKSEAFFSKFKKQILIAVVAIIVIVAGAVLYNAYVSGPREDKASTQSLRVSSTSTRSSLTRLSMVTAQAMLDSSK